MLNSKWQVYAVAVPMLAFGLIGEHCQDATGWLLMNGTAVAAGEEENKDQPEPEVTQDSGSTAGENQEDANSGEATATEVKKSGQDKGELPLLDLSKELTDKSAINNTPTQSGVLSGGITSMQQNRDSGATAVAELPNHSSTGEDGKSPISDRFDLEDRQRTLSFGAAPGETPFPASPILAEAGPAAIPPQVPPAAPVHKPGREKTDSGPDSTSPKPPVSLPLTRQAAPEQQAEPQEGAAGITEQLASGKPVAEEAGLPEEPGQDPAELELEILGFQDGGSGTYVENDFQVEYVPPGYGESSGGAKTRGSSEADAGGGGLASNLRNLLIALMACGFLALLLFALSFDRHAKSQPAYKVQESIEVELGWRLLIVESAQGTSLLGISPGSINLLAELPMHSQDVRYSETINKLVIAELKQPDDWPSRPLFVPETAARGSMPPLAIQPPAGRHAANGGRRAEEVIREKLVALFSLDAAAGPAGA